ncbi:hypothetical protein ACFX14_003417 [Malus domestica]
MKDELVRSDRLISTKEALNHHINFYKKFRSQKKIEHPIFTMGRIFQRSFDSPRALKSNSGSNLGEVEKVRWPPLVRSGSCFPSLSR